MTSDGKIKQAYETLNRFSPNPGNSALTKNSVSEQPEYNLQIVVPAYNSEAYIEECLSSIINQKTQYTFKVVVVNDGSTDKTAELLKNYEKYDFIEIIHQENKGHSGARNSALKNIDAEYIMFVDSDDYITENAVESLVGLAKKNNTSVVIGSYFTFNDSSDTKKEYLCRNYCGDDKSDISGFTCMKIFRSDFFRDFSFPLGYLFEDTIIKYLIISQCDKICTTEDIVYAYRSNPESITNTFAINPRQIECYWVTEQLIKDAFALDIANKQYLYEITLKQIWSNSGRTRHAPDEIKKAMFVLSCNLMKKYFGGYKTSSLVMKPLEIALRAKSYVLYKLYCDSVSKYLDSRA